jgi:hypothetical protein
VHIHHQPPAAACARECDVLIMTSAAYQIMTSIASVTHPLSHRHSQQCSCCECDCGNCVKPETNPSGGGQVSVPVTSQPSHHKPYTSIGTCTPLYGLVTPLFHYGPSRTCCSKARVHHQHINLQRTLQPATSTLTTIKNCSNHRTIDHRGAGGVCRTAHHHWPLSDKCRMKASWKHCSAP